MSHAGDRDVDPEWWGEGLFKGRGLEPQGKRGYQKGMPEIPGSCKMYNCFMTLEDKGAGTTAPKGFMAPHFWNKATKSGEASGPGSSLFREQILSLVLSE